MNKDMIGISIVSSYIRYPERGNMSSWDQGDKKKHEIIFETQNFNHCSGFLLTWLWISSLPTNFSVKLTVPWMNFIITI